MPDPTQLHPRGVSEIIDDAFHLYRAHAPALLRRVAAVIAPLAVVQAATQINSAGAVSWESILPLRADLLARMLTALAAGDWAGETLGAHRGELFFFVLALVMLAESLTLATARLYLGEQDTTLPPARGYAAAAALIPAALAVLPFATLYALAASVLGLAANTVVVWQQTSIPLLAFAKWLALRSGPALLLSAGAAAICAPLLCTAQAAVLEGRGALASVRRSWQLARGSWRAVALTALITTALTALLIGLPGMAASAIQAQFWPIDQSNLPGRLANVLAQAILALCLPFQTAVFTVLYYDLRVRKEAFDLEQRAGQLAPAKRPADA
jgi:hypothetical protein